MQQSKTGKSTNSDTSFASVPELKGLTIDDLRKRLKEIDPEMERAVAELRKRYEIKRKPILAALSAKTTAAAATLK